MKDPDLAIVGGGVGGCAAALSACSLGLRVVMTEQYGWVGGQLTSQCVPPDEHPWIEEFGCTARYRDFRDRVRRHYRSHESLTPASLEDSELNPGGGWVSRLCCRPDIAHGVLRDMLQPFIDEGLLEVCVGVRPIGVETDGDKIVAVELSAGKVVRAPYYLDATETGELLALSKTEHVIGAECKRDTDEPHAVDGDPEPDNVQGVTWCAAVGFDQGGRHTIEPPDQYDFWADLQPKGWPDKLLSFKMLHAQRGEVIELPLFGNDGYNLFSYRQIVDGSRHTDGREDAAVMNWPMNDFYVSTILGRPDLALPEVIAERRLDGARQLTLSLLYWLQTEAPRHDEGVGYPELRLRPDLTGTDDGLAMAPYIRESRRIKAMFTVKEQHVSAECNPGLDRAPEFEDTVGIGAYRIDLHPSTNGRPTIDLGSLPFQIPLGALVPVRTQNLIPACKNIGVTHVTNGCYRLHPVEWNIGEAAATLAAICIKNDKTPQEIHASRELVQEVQSSLVSQGAELSWPDSPLHAL